MKEELRVLLDQLAENLLHKLQDRVSLVFRPRDNPEHERNRSNTEDSCGPLSACHSWEWNIDDREDQPQQRHQLLKEFKIKLDRTLDSVRLDLSSVVTDCVTELDNLVQLTSQLGDQVSSNTNSYPTLSSQLELPPVGVITTHHPSVL